MYIVTDGRFGPPVRCGVHMSREAGFSLLEALIASTVFCLGLAGFAALLLAGIMGSAEARRQGAASVAAASLAEHIRLNPDAFDRFLNPPESISRICTGDAGCTPQQQADFDFRLWRLELADRIPGSIGVVCLDATPADGARDDFGCDGAGPPVIKIFWDGGLEAAAEGRHRFVLELT